jgi:hypothetical protein
MEPVTGELCDRLVSAQVSSRSSGGGIELKPQISAGIKSSKNEATASSFLRTIHLTNVLT